MATIRDLPSGWRDALMPADFDGNPFHVESNAIQNGRRIVLHQFPKKDQPYAEDMGRQAFTFTVVGYCIQFPFDLQAPLWLRDYRVARDLLAERLSQGGPGLLQLPTATEKLPPIYVVCTRHELREERERGGFCVFNMNFTEVGAPPFGPAPDGKMQMMQQSNALRNEVKRMMSNVDARVKRLRQMTPPLGAVAPLMLPGPDV
jgi:prophage DNA circulation protein